MGQSIGAAVTYFIPLEDEEEEEKEEPEPVPKRGSVYADKKSLVLTNIPCKTTSDYLEFHIDKTTGLSAKKGDYEVISKTECCYIVNFRSVGKHACN